jgi:branched-chain amino acid transport system substrate-binding protein
LQAAGAAAEGTYMSFVAGDSQTEMLTAFTEAYVAKFGVEPSQLGPFHGQSHDSVMVIADAIKRTAQVDDAGNLVIDREALIAAVRATADLAGITGTLSCDANGECGAGGIQIFIVENGEFKQIAGFGM